MNRKLALRDILSDSTGPEIESALRRWVTRDDGVAVYENQDLGSPNAGHRKYASYGSKEALFEADEPPPQLPDTSTQINWAYALVGTYRRCCVLDDDGDGNCHIHASRGVLR